MPLNVLHMLAINHFILGGDILVRARQSVLVSFKI